MKEWKDIDLDDCPECGASVQAFTYAPEGLCYDGDTIRCMDCGFRGGVSVCSETGDTWVQDP